MARQTFETEEDRRIEREAAKIICELWGCETIKMKPLYSVDFAMMVFDDVVGVLEIRSRKYSYDELDKLGGIYMSVHKWDEFKKWNEKYKLASVFAVCLTDGIYALIAKRNIAFEYPKDLKIKITKTENPRDEWDFEPAVLLPMNMFRKISDVTTLSRKRT